MLTIEQAEIIKATVPLLETGGEVLTTHFYKIMLDEHPESRPLFNQAHQQLGTQPRALANAVLQYARHIDNLDALGQLPAQIIQKHVSLQVQPEHYPMVGSCLLRAIREVLGKEIATDAVIEAWGAAYWQLANILMGAEGEQYDQIESAPGGWRGARKFFVIEKRAESPEITSFVLAPVDGGAVLNFRSGQYLGLKLLVDGQEVRRNYSLSKKADGSTLQISVKREHKGVVSNYLHDQLEVKAVLDVFPPAGEFVLQPSAAPLVLISGGVGITPTLAMAETALEQGDRDVTFIHYARNPEVQAFRGILDTWARKYPRFKLFLVYENGATKDLASGRPNLEQIQRWVPPNAEAYFLGPKPFMQCINKALAEHGFPVERRHFEFFGPAEELN
ncbi:NO-inducible flavohemoprotein [Polynucleobacter sp.]|jgi:nitric oxide dioxygenase|uniref:NO-inducible flavohemoprotein n=1 Tax=Polynucleobacter sp. TaxID=2029855 RepID=UPI0037CAFCE5